MKKTAFTPLLLCMTAPWVLAGSCKCDTPEQNESEVTTPSPRRTVPGTSLELLHQLSALELPPGVVLEGSDALAVPAVVSGVLSPASGLELWKSLHHRVNPDRIQVIVVNNLVLENNPPLKTPEELDHDRKRAAELRASAFFRDREKAKEIHWDEILEKYQDDRHEAKNPIRSRRRERDAITAADLAVRQRDQWNECPHPCQHAAVMKHWREVHGAHLVFAGRDTLEFQVQRPPSSLDELKTIAWQQYLYCEDIIEQGYGSMTELARGLDGSSHWTFWWD